jgi:hypothetical protein
VAITSKQVIDTVKNLTDIERDLHLEEIPEGAGFWWKLIHLDPAVYRGVVTSVLAIFTSFGFAVSDQKSIAIVSLVAAIAFLVQAFWTRGAVTPNKKVLAYKPDPINRPSKIVPGEAVSSDIIAVANAAAVTPSNPHNVEAIPFPTESGWIK